MRGDALGQERDRLLGIRPVVDHEERADVVPRRVRDERRAPLGSPGNAVALERHAASSGGGSTRPRVSQLSRSNSTATGSNRKYDRGGSGPQVFDEYRSSG